MKLSGEHPKRCPGCRIEEGTLHQQGCPYSWEDGVTKHLWTTPVTDLREEDAVRFDR